MFLLLLVEAALFPPFLSSFQFLFLLIRRSNCFSGETLLLPRACRRRRRRRGVCLHFVGEAGLVSGRHRRHRLTVLLPSLSALSVASLPSLAAFRLGRAAASATTAAFGSPALTVLSFEAGPALADVVPDADASAVTVVAAIGAVFAAASDVTLLAEAVAVGSASTAVVALLDEARLVLESAVFAEFEADRGALERLAQRLVANFEDEFEVGDAGFESGAGKGDPEVGGMTRNHAAAGDRQLEPLHDSWVLGPDAQELVSVFGAFRPPFAPAAGPRHVDGICERRDRREPSRKLGTASDVIRQLVVLDDFNLHRDAGESPDLVLADPHGHFEMGGGQES